MLPEGRYDLVAPPSAPLGVLVLHPHPDFGGDRFNPVVDAVYRASVDEGWAAVRPDFSASDLDFATREASEALDLLPAGVALAVVGYSFGAIIAGRIVDERVGSWVLVAPPFGLAGSAVGLPIGTDPRPKLVLVPAHDQYCAPSMTTEEIAGWETAYLESIEGADHFLAGATAKVAAAVVRFLG